jgi:hypothetical protein
MSGITFLSRNLFDNATISLTTGTENSQFPLVNLKNDSPSVKFRSVGSTAVVLIDLLTTQAIDHVAIAADPADLFLISSATFKTSTTTDFSMSPTNTITLSSEHSIGYKSITEVTHRYVELTIVGSGGFAELGKVFVGKAINIPQNGISISSFSYGYDDKSVIKKNKYDQRFIDRLNTVKSLGGSIEYCTKAEQEEIDDMLIRHAKSVPIWVITDPDSEAMNEGQYKLAIYGYLDNQIKWSASGGQLYSTSIDVSQAI